jgi:predicted ferric reductase
MILPSLILYLFDIIIRYKSTHKALYSHIKMSGSEKYNTSCILINIEILKTVKTKPGSYFFICFKDISGFEWHPLSLIFQTNDNLLFCAKDMGKNSWTNKLKLFDSENLGKTEMFKKRDVYLQGPYYHITIDYKLNKYKHIFCIAGGIGITPIISIIQDIQKLFLKNKLSKLKKVYLIWIIPHVTLLETFNSILTKFDSIIDINIYCTKKSNLFDINFNFYYTKPKIDKLLDEYIINNNIDNKLSGVICCGPNSLSKDVINICYEKDIEFSNENF